MNETSFESLVGPEIDRLYRLAFRLTDDRSDAEDLVQDVLIRAYERRTELTSIEALGAWLGRVLYNRFIDNRRKYERRRLAVVTGSDDVVDTAQAEPTASVAPDLGAERELDISRLRQALSKLSIEHRAIVQLHDAEGYNLSEIQVITGVPIGTLKSRLHRARARLRGLLTAEGTFRGA